MQNENNPIPAQSIETVRLTCKRCGVAVIMPLAITHNVPPECSNCATTFNAGGVLDFMRKLKYFQSDLVNIGTTFSVHLEQRQA